MVSFDIHDESGEQSWEIRELYPTDDGRFGYTKNSVKPFGNSYAELISDLKHMRQDFGRDVLDLRPEKARLVPVEQLLEELAPDNVALPLDTWTVPTELGKLAEGSPKVVCICGSTRFDDEMTEANLRLTLAGAIVVAPAVFQHQGDVITDEQKQLLDELHLAKIDLADAIFVVDPNGYIGESTRREIKYAQSTGKAVFRLSTLLGL